MSVGNLPVPYASPVYVPYAISPTKGTIVPLDLGQPCWSAAVRNACPFTVYVKNGVGITTDGLGNVLDPLALPVSPNAYGIVAMSGARNVTVRVDNPKSKGATFQNPMITVTLSSVPEAPRETSLAGATVTQVTHPVVDVGTGADLWKPTAGTTARVYSIVLSGDTAGDYAAQDSNTGGNIAAARLAVGIPAMFDYKPFGFLLSAVNAKVTVTGPGLITATATGDEE